MAEQKKKNSTKKQNTAKRSSESAQRTRKPTKAELEQLRVEEEIQKATDAGISPITLGKRILRTETAGMTVLAWIMYQLAKPSSPASSK